MNRFTLAVFMTLCVHASASTSYLAASNINSLSGSADIGGCGTVCPGGKNVQNLGGPGNGTMQFNLVSAPATGQYATTITYDNGSSGDLPAAVSVNGGSPVLLHLPSTGSWNRAGSAAITLPLNAGKNSVRFSSPQPRSWIGEICQLIVPDHPVYAIPGAASASLSPSSLAFGNQTVNSASTARTVTLTNGGNQPLTVTGITASAPFSQTNNCGTSLAAGANCTVSVVFTPTTATASTGTLSVADNASGSPQTVSLSGTGTAVVAQVRPYAYVNSGHNGLGAAGSNSVALSWTPYAGDAVVVGIDCWGNTTACGVGSVTDNLNNTYTLLGTVQHGVANVVSALYCSNVSTATAGMSVTAAFTNQATGSDSDVTVSDYSGVSCTRDGLAATANEGGNASATYSAGPLTTTNTNDLLIGYGTSSQGTAPTAGAGFTMRQNNGGQEVYGFEDRVVLAAGAYTLTETTSQATTWGMIGAALPIVGTVSGSPNASLSPSSLTFASQTTGTSSAAQTVTLTNAGSAALTISSIAASASYSATNTCGSTLAVSASCSVSVVFSPSAAGTITGTLTVTDNAANSPQTVALSGTAAAPVASGGTTPSVGAGGTNTPASGALTLSSVSGCGSAHTGGDDTTCLQNAINYSASNAVQVRIAAGSYNSNTLNLPSNTNIFLDAGVTITANSGFSGGTSLVLAQNVSNITVMGAQASQSIIHMRKSEYTDGDEYRHCFNMHAVTTAMINGISCNDAGGDGFYIAGNGGSQLASKSITLQNVIANNNSRDALSVISVDGLLLDHVTLSNTIGNPNSGTAPHGPWDGIDFEPNPNSSGGAGTDYLHNVTIQNTLISGNGRACVDAQYITSDGVHQCKIHNGNGITVLNSDTAASSPTTSVTINNVTTTNNLGSGYFLINGPPAPLTGTVLVENSTSQNDGQWGIVLYFWDAGGLAATFTNDTILNPQQGYGVTTDNAGFAASAGGGDPNSPGNYTVTGLNETYSGQYYFNISPFNSGNGMHNIHIGNFGTLSGQTGSTLGYLTGTGGVNSVNIP